jgi:hypothetical protein
MTPLRQFRGVPADVIRKAEGKQFVSVPLLGELSTEPNWPYSLGIDISTLCATSHTIYPPER